MSPYVAYLNSFSSVASGLIGIPSAEGEELQAAQAMGIRDGLRARGGSGGSFAYLSSDPKEAPVPEKPVLLPKQEFEADLVRLLAESPKS